MTEDYKEDILKYVTNNVTPTSGTNEPIFEDSVLNKSVTNQIKTHIGSFSYFGYLFDEDTQNIIIYGTYGGNNNNEYGFIYIMDRNLTEIQMITTFTSGSNIFPLWEVHIDENGYFYAISRDNNKTQRILLLNNVFAKIPDGTYQVRLRQSYIIPNSNDYRFEEDMATFSYHYLRRLIKVPGEATYYFLTYKIGQATNTYIWRFTINVGSENEWVIISAPRRLSGADMLIEKTGDEHTLYLYYSNYNKTFYEATIKNDIFTSTKTITTDLHRIQYCFAKSKDEVYLSCFELSGLNVTNYYLEKIENNSTILIDTYASTDDIDIQMQKNIVFIYANSKVGILQNDTPYYYSGLPQKYTVVNFFVMVSYNLVNIYVATGTALSPTTTKLTLDYNANNYNGLEYEDYNQTLATKARLFSNGEMVFARNLYNTTLLGNIATSNLQVPNTLINGIPIVVEGLIGATNGILITDSTPIVKNIYETLYVNFIRSINVIDEDTNTDYPGTANYVNQNINTATQQNCEDTFVGKVKINYTNNSIVQNITWSYVTDHYETKFVIDATNEVPSIDFMSNDETTIYITKELDISTGSYYVVTQKLRIE